MSEKNLFWYEKLRKVPVEALKEIKAGRLKGMSDINPMWRIKMLTETFGPCGFGWKYEIDDKHIQEAHSFKEDGSPESVAVVDILLYVKGKDGWSEPIPGTGGSKFVSQESRGLHVNDECFKMALTDAISVACKALGMGADVYWNKDRTKYNGEPEPEPAAKSATKEEAEKVFDGKDKPEPKPKSNGEDTRVITNPQWKRMLAIAKGDKELMEEVSEAHGFEPSDDGKKPASISVTRSKYDAICDEIDKRANEPKDVPLEAADVSDDDVPF